MAFLRRLLGKEKRQACAASEAAAPAAVGDGRAQVGWISEIGQQRTSNEDAVLVIRADQAGSNSLPSFGLFVLADGMGGHQAGEVASCLAVRAAARHILQHIYLVTLQEQEHNAEQPSLKEVLEEATQRANAIVSSAVPGGGTTLTCALVLGNQVVISHVGDSRAYLVFPDHLERVTHDHSLVDRLVELGQLSSAEAAHHPQKNVLYRAVGQGGLLEVDVVLRSISPDHGLLLCSDGLWGMLSEEEIVAIIGAAPTAQAACDALAAAANRAGGRDNISAVLVRFPSGW